MTTQNQNSPKWLKYISIDYMTYKNKVTFVSIVKKGYQILSYCVVKHHQEHHHRAMKYMYLHIYLVDGKFHGNLIQVTYKGVL